MKLSTIILLAFCLLSQHAMAQDPSITGNIWIDFDFNWTYDNDQGIDGVKIYLRNTETDEIIDSTFSDNQEFTFPSNNGIVLPADDYYLEIPKSQWNSDGPLDGFTSCPVDNQADDGIDNDDNGLGTDHRPIKTSSFPLDATHIEYVDFCFLIGCNSENLLAVPACDQIQEIDIICDVSILGTFCNKLPSTTSPGNQPTPICPDGGVAGNISWFAFVAYDGNYEITISPTFCQGSTTGNEGMQMGIYTDCSFTESVFCSSDCNLSPITFESSLLIPGDTYYLFLDGCQGSICHYEIDITGNPIFPNIEVENLCILSNGNLICADVEYCPNETLTFEALIDNSDFTFNWEITTLSGVPYTEDSSPETTENTIDLTFANEGVYSVCITSLQHPCSNFGWFGYECVTVTIDDDLEHCDDCAQDTIEPFLQAVDFSSAVLSANGEVKVYAIDFKLFATDECTPDDSLVYAFNPQGPAYDEYYDASVRSSYTYLDCCNVVNSPEDIAIFVFDLKGNAATDTIPTTIVHPNNGCEGCENDTFPPVLETIPSLLWLFDKDSSQIEIWASDFVASASDNCTGPSNLKFSFTSTSPFDDPESSFKIFYCEDVENSPFILPIYAWDKSGNYVLDSAELVLQPEMGLDCDNFAEDISGRVLRINNTPIQGAMVYLETSNGETIDSVSTDENGFYSLFAVPAQKFLRIDYATSDAPIITFMDLVAVQQYMLGLIPFTTPEIFAADLNGDGKVRVNDLRIMRKIIFGIIDQNEYLSHTWKFSTIDGDISQSEINRFVIEQAQMPDLIGYRVGDLR